MHILIIFIYALIATFVLINFQSCLSDLGAAATRFKDVLDFGFTQLKSNAVKPRVKPLTDSYLSTSHTMTEVSLHTTYNCYNLI